MCFYFPRQVLLIALCVILSSIPYSHANGVCYDCLIADFGKLNETLFGCHITYMGAYCNNYSKPVQMKTTFEGVQIEDSNLTLLPSLVEQTPHVRGVLITALNISSIDTDAICKWKDLWEIKIEGNSLKTLPSRFFFDCHRLYYLYLPRNKIAEIANDTFDNLSKLNSLDLSFNQINALHKDTFKPLGNLMELNLKGNQLQTIEAELFNHNPHLDTIYLSNNDLRTIEKSLLVLKRISILEVDGNYNLESIDLPHMWGEKSVVNVSNCNLKTLYIPPNVEQIYAMHNQISFIKIHPDNKMRILDLSRNNLVDFTHVAGMESLKNLNYLNLKYNGIHNVDFNEIGHLKQLNTLKIEINPNQTVPVAEIKKKIPVLRFLFISARDLSSKQKAKIQKECNQHGVHVDINKNDPISTI